VISSTPRAELLLAIALVAAACDEQLDAAHHARCALGVRAQPGDGATAQEALLTFEALIDRTVDLDRQYRTLDDDFPGAHEVWSAEGGRTPLVSITSRLGSGEIIPWADVADPSDPRAAPLVDDLVARLRDFDHPVLVIFHSEPEEDPAYGSPADYVAAFRRVVDAAREGGAAATWVWSLGSGAFPTEADAWYPGDDWVDWIGVSGFNSFGDGETRWRTFPSIFAPFREWALPHGRPLLVTTTASAENLSALPDAPRSKATWILEALATLEDWPEIQGFVWFQGPGPDANRQWAADSSPAALAAFRELAAAPHLDVTGERR
jgi:hypothetical protein